MTKPDKPISETQLDFLQDKFQRLHHLVQTEVLQQMSQLGITGASHIIDESLSDVVFAIDRACEQVVLDFCCRQLSQDFSFVLIAEGIGEPNYLIFPDGVTEEQAQYRVVMDPIDGTRSLMFDKRSAWILTGIAVNRGDVTNLSDLFFAMQTEIPISKQGWMDQWWSSKISATRGVRWQRFSNQLTDISPAPSPELSILQGYASFVKFLPHGKELLANMEAKWAQRLFGATLTNEIMYFDDQYLCSGGQLHELIAGHDRFIADLRGLVGAVLQQQGKKAGLSCHPYDLCTELVARQAGVLITDIRGNQLATPLDTTTAVSWLGFANQAIYQQVMPALQQVLSDSGWI